MRRKPGPLLDHDAHIARLAWWAAFLATLALIAILGIASTGFEIDWNKVIFKMLHLKGIYGREMFETWYKMIALVQGPLDVSGLITHRIGIDDRWHR